MKVAQNSFALTVVLVLSIAAYYIANSMSFFGKIVNHFHPCVQKTSESFPCYGIYDLGVMTASVIIGVLFFTLLIVNLYRHMKKTN